MATGWVGGQGDSEEEEEKEEEEEEENKRPLHQPNSVSRAKSVSASVKATWLSPIPRP